MNHQDATRINELQTELAKQQVKIEAMEREINLIVKNMTIQGKTLKDIVGWMGKVQRFFGAKVN